MQPNDFNSRPSARGDASCDLQSKERTLFQFTPLREGRHYMHRSGQFHFWHFNSRPSARGDNFQLRWHIRASISIHAPPRGATGKGSGAGRTGRRVFQFTPLREGRRRNETMKIMHKVFQFTPLREGRLEDTVAFRWDFIFQFTPLREGRRACRFLVFCGFPFQFTPLREGRPSSDAHAPRRRPFQFTPLREGRPAAAFSDSRKQISIHAPPRGATTSRTCGIHA